MSVTVGNKCQPISPSTYLSSVSVISSCTRPKPSRAKVLAEVVVSGVEVVSITSHGEVGLEIGGEGEWRTKQRERKEGRRKGGKEGRREGDVEEEKEEEKEVN